ncbi:MAG: hypothetical protein Q8R53_05030, partial [Nanoarchaeota archaeon]|nr:hypothetical protein [Nanoarchaeota archaeon]
VQEYDEAQRRVTLKNKSELEIVEQDQERYLVEYSYNFLDSVTDGFTQWFENIKTLVDSPKIYKLLHYNSKKKKAFVQEITDEGVRKEVLGKYFASKEFREEAALPLPLSPTLFYSEKSECATSGRRRSLAAVNWEFAGEIFGKENIKDHPKKKRLEDIREDRRTIQQIPEYITTKSTGPK